MSQGRSRKACHASQGKSTQQKEKVCRCQRSTNEWVRNQLQFTRQCLKAWQSLFPKISTMEAQYQPVKNQTQDTWNQWTNKQLHLLQPANWHVNVFHYEGSFLTTETLINDLSAAELLTMCHMQSEPTKMQRKQQVDHAQRHRGGECSKQLGRLESWISKKRR